jgi:hypothetical protein
MGVNLRSLGSDTGNDARRVKPLSGQERGVIAVINEAVRQPQCEEPRDMAKFGHSRKGFQHRSTRPAREHMLLNGHQEVVLMGALAQTVQVEWLDEPHIHHPGLELACRPKCRGDHAAKREESHAQAVGTRAALHEGLCLAYRQWREGAACLNAHARTARITDCRRAI